MEIPKGHPYFLDETAVKDILQDIAQNQTFKPTDAGGLEKCGYCWHAQRYHTLRLSSGLMKCKYHSCRHKCKGFMTKAERLQKGN